MKQSTASQQDKFRDDLSFFNTFLMAFAFVALFVGTFIIYNTFSILAAQRSKDMAMLRAIGAGRKQLLRSMLFESVAVGVVAGAIGLVAGVGMSYVLKGLLAAVGLEIPAGATVVSTGTIVTSFVVGVSVTVVSALAPAIKASRVKPIAALRDVSVDRSAVSVKRTLVGLGVTALGVLSFAAGVTGDGSSALQLLGLGALTTIMGVFVLGPVIARPVIKVIGWPVSKATGVTGELARENATRSPKRTSATAAALMIGVALVGFITILAASTKASVAAGVEKSLPGRLRGRLRRLQGGWLHTGPGRSVANPARGRHGDPGSHGVRSDRRFVDRDAGPPTPLRSATCTTCRSPKVP